MKGGNGLASLDESEVALVSEAVATCAAEQEDQLTGRKVAMKLLNTIHDLISQGTPMYTILTALWVVLHTLSEEWRDAHNG